MYLHTWAPDSHTHRIWQSSWLIPSENKDGTGCLKSLKQILGKNQQFSKVDCTKPFQRHPFGPSHILCAEALQKVSTAFSYEQNSRSSNVSHSLTLHCGLMTMPIL